MLLTITTTKPPATDLGFLLHKNPRRVQSFDLSFGKAHVFYPDASPERCTAALLLDVDPVGLVRTRRGPSGEGGMLEQYVNDRPYVASSFMSVAIARVPVSPRLRSAPSWHSHEDSMVWGGLRVDEIPLSVVEDAFPELRDND
jgi:hypothetical protein